MSQKRYCIKWGECEMMGYVYAETVQTAISKLISDLAVINGRSVKISIKSVERMES